MIVNIPSQTELSSFYIVYDGSTLIEDQSNWGISHLTEHLMCKAFEHLFDDFERDGIQWNAYTANNEVVFFLSGLEDKVNKYKHGMLQLLNGHTVEEDTFQNERSIVLEEYMDYFNDQVYTHHQNLHRKLFGYYDSIGSRRALEGLTLEDINRFIALQYASPSRIINVSQSSPFEADVRFQSLKRPLVFTQPETFEYDCPNQFQDKSSVIILFPGLTSGFAHIAILNQMLSRGLTSPLYQEVREKRGMAYYVSNNLDRFHTTGINYISTQTSNENAGAVCSVIGEVLEHPEKFLTPERLEIVREAMIVDKRVADILRHAHVQKYIAPPDWDATRIIETVTYEELMETFKTSFNLSRAYTSIDKKEFD